CTLDGTSKSYCTPESYAGQSASLYRNKGDGTFENVTRAAGLYDPSSKALGVALIDVNADGWMDLFVANDTQPNRRYRNNRNVKYAQPPHLFRNLGSRRFEDVSRQVGMSFQQPMVARGAAYGDYDRDGDLDLLISTNNGPARLLRNDGDTRNNSIRVTTIGTS